VIIEIPFLQIEGWGSADPHKTRKMVLRRSMPPQDPIPRKGETMRFISRGEDVEREIDKVEWVVNPNDSMGPVVHLKPLISPDTEKFDKREADWTDAGFVSRSKETMTDDHMEWVRKGDHLTDG